MKKHVIMMSFFVMTISLIAAAQDRDVTLEITKVSSQANTMKPALVRAITNLETAKRWVQQKINCLVFDEESCTKTDVLITNYALGFAMAASLPIHMFGEALYRSGKTSNVNLLFLAQFAAELILGAAGLKGTALQPYISGLRTRITSAYILMADAAGIIQQTPGTSFAFLKALGNYLAMNTKCIWSESYCEQSLYQSENGITISPFGRRLALYYWLGVASGMAWRAIPFKKLTGAARKAVSTAKQKLTPAPIPTFIPLTESF